LQWLESRMPEPITALLALGIGKLFTVHAAHAAVAHTVVAGTASAGHAHAAAYLVAGVAAGSTLFAIGICLNKLVNAGAMTERDAKSMMEKAKTMPEEDRKEMHRDVKGLCNKWGL
jgi:hypothetical protein